MNNKKTYKVLFLGWEYYPVFTGGLGIVCNAIAEELSNKGVEVYVVLPSIPKNLPITNVHFPIPNNKLNFKKIFTTNNFTVNLANIELNPYQNSKLEYKKDINITKSIKQSHMKTSDNNTSELLYGDDMMDKVTRYTERIKDLVVDIDFDIIHAHDWMTYLAATEARDISGKKCVMHVHATELDRTANRPNELIFNIEKHMLKAADMVIAVSNLTKAKLVNQYNLPESKIRVIHNALDEKHSYNVTKKLNFGKGKVIMFLGRAVVQKGTHIFIQVAKKVLQKLPNTIFVFAGDGDRLPEAIDEVCRIGIQDNFIFTGSVDRYHGDILYKNADLFLMTSISEPFGITALEAIRQGTPVIVTKSSGVSEVLPNALAVDFWDSDKFADYAINILSDDTLYKLLLESQSKDYSKLKWNDQVDKIIEIYSLLLNTDR